jgi:hypothetical protein
VVSGVLRHLSMKLSAAVGALLLCSLAVQAQESIVFRGTPNARVFSSVKTDGREEMQGEAADKAECVVVRRGKKYYWASRENVLLVRTDAAQFTYFVHPESGGYVKVFTGDRKAANAPADYIEHINRGFETVTYWGRVSGYREE